MIANSMSKYLQLPKNTVAQDLRLAPNSDRCSLTAGLYGCPTTLTATLKVRL